MLHLYFIFFILIEIQSACSTATKGRTLRTRENNKVNLIKRMEEKTKHISEANERLRRRSLEPRRGKNSNVLSLKQKAVQPAAFIDGKVEKNQSPSLMSQNNFINFCVSKFGQVGGAVIMNGAQSQDKPACNGVPMGMVPAKNKLPACKFVSPKNLDKIKSGQTFEVTLGLENLVAGIFTNPKSTYLGAPIQLDPDTKTVLGHTHIVIQKLKSLDSTEIIDPTDFFFFKGIDEAAQDGKVSVQVNDGLPTGFWRLASITTASNHQSISGPVAQRGPLDDMIYITSE